MPVFRPLSAALAAASLAVAGAVGIVALPAAADPVESCTPTRGAVVAVDFGAFGGPVVRGCDATPTTGMDLLHEAGFTTAGTQHDGPGFICRLGHPSYDGGTQYPVPADQPCTATPGADAYWSYWIALPGASTWSYSTRGALSDVPVAGEVEAWVYGGTDVGGTTGQPTFSPDDVRAAAAPTTAPPTTTTPPPTTTAPAGPTVTPVPDAAVATAAHWLVGQLTDGDHVVNPYSGEIDYSRTAQAGLALAAAGTEDGALAKVLAWTGENVALAYPDGAVEPAAAGYAALLAEATGNDPHDVGGKDLLAGLAGSVCPAAGANGACTAGGDFQGAFGPGNQAVALLALRRAGVGAPAAAVARLTGTACSDGGYAGVFLSAGDSCESAPDVTGLAVLALGATANGWLAGAQSDDGGYLPYAYAPTGDTAATGQAGQGLLALHADTPAAAARGWLGARQQADGGLAPDAATEESDLFSTILALPALAGTTLAAVSHEVAVPGGPTTTPTAPPAGGPDLAAGSTYLAKNLLDGTYYEAFPDSGFADFGLTVDGAFALAATGQDDATLRRIADFYDTKGTDGSGRTVDDWTGIGTEYVTGGALGKEAVLAEVVGRDPRNFGGHDLIAGLKAATCAAADDSIGCAGPGNYVYGTSVFSQSLGVIAQLRAGAAEDAQAPLAYLAGLQNADGSFPSLIPASGDSEVDSTAMALMALDLAGEHDGAVQKGLAWLAGQQLPDGGFPGASGDSVNSAALAVQGLSLDATAYAGQIGKARAFLKKYQNADGGFRVAADGPAESDVRASTQALGGAVGTSFGTLTRELAPGGTTTPTPTPTATATGPTSPTPTASSSDVPPIAGGDGGGPGGLADTGAGEIGRLAAVGGGLLAAGLALLLAVRRRTRTEEVAR